MALLAQDLDALNVVVQALLQTPVFLAQRRKLPTKLSSTLRKLFRCNLTHAEKHTASRQSCRAPAAYSNPLSTLTTDFFLLNRTALISCPFRLPTGTVDISRFY